MKEVTKASLPEMKHLVFRKEMKEINNININFFSISIVRKSTEKWHAENVNSPYHRLYFILDGDGYIDINHPSRTHVYLKPGNVYLLPRNTTFNYGCESFIYKFYVHITTELFPGTDIFGNLGRCLSLPFSEEETLNILNRISSGSFLSFKTAIMNIVLKFSDECSRLGLLDFNYKIEPYLPLLNHIQEHLSCKTKITDIAVNTGYSAGVLSKHFKRDTGISLKKYIDRMLLEKACQLLISKDLSIAEISEQLGFCDQFYFSRFFKKLTGYTPRSYRTANII